MPKPFRESQGSDMELLLAWMLLIMPTIESVYDLINFCRW